MSDPKVAVALLSQSGELARHLREALAAAGVPLVYEAVPAQLDRPALEQSGAVVVVVNLDNEVEAQLDDIYALLDDDRYNVIFNEGQVSSQLSGWELARWARHLAAKITGANDIDPPRPEDAEAVPTPAPRRVPAELASSPADTADTAVAADDSGAETQAATAAPVTVEAEFDFADLDVFARLLAEDEGLPAVAESDERVIPVIADEEPTGETLDSWLDFDPPPTPPAATNESNAVSDEATPVVAADNTAVEFDFDLDFELPSTPEPTARVDAAHADAAPRVMPDQTSDVVTPLPAAEDAAAEFEFDLDFSPVTAPELATPTDAVSLDAATAVADLDFAIDFADPPPVAGDPPAANGVADTTDQDFELEFGEIDASLTPADDGADDSEDWMDMPVSEAGGSTDAGVEIDFSDLDAFAGEIDFGDEAELLTTDVAAQLAEPVIAEGAPIDMTALPLSDVHLDSADALQLIDIDLTDSAADMEPGAEEQALPPVPQLGSAFGWELEGMGDTAEVDAEAARAKPAEFGIEKISAVEYLAVETDPAASSEFSGGLGLELMPLEEAVLPQQQQHQGHESWLDPNTTMIRVRRVWVLGASIGGPEALREFLGAFSSSYPALFVLAQHTSAGLTDLMVQQLAKATSMRVHVPAHGERVSQGEVIVVPPTHRLRVDAEGVVVLEALSDAAAGHLPSIDQVVADVADGFGEKAGAIIFSGMTEDAAIGCSHLAQLGGKVYVQDPSTCVVSSMIDGVIASGVVGFSGTPQELANKLLAEPA